METDSAGQKVATNIRGLELISQINNENKQKYYLSNAHGDILDVINRQGDILNNYKYDPFGNITEQMETLPNRYKYAGEQYDEVTGKYYLRARHYDPQVGRFMQEDTYRGDGLNLYTYVANNPLKYVDPSGYSKCANNSSSSRYDKYSNLIAYNNINPKKITDHYLKANSLNSEYRTVKITLPNGNESFALRKDGKIMRFDEKSLDDGTIIHTAKGDYIIKKGKEVPVKKEKREEKEKKKEKKKDTSNVKETLKSGAGTASGIAGELKENSTKIVNGSTEVNPYKPVGTAGNAVVAVTLANDLINTVVEDNGNTKNQKIIKGLTQVGGTGINVATGYVTARSAVAVGSPLAVESMGTSYIMPFYMAMSIDKKVAEQVEILQDKIYKKYNIK
ncbi:RHS repeat-associated core domain-containing protein [Anaerovorax odorimutans]|uniref:RHS repeat-associated core domain-containing protein n=1 Tax=Anaerovorax odorimutans TaxID=109327 RepID=UPI000421BFD0|nr:RHS repeat-associated core domain-containing protein [Anaerovorax odorimutans]